MLLRFAHGPELIRLGDFAVRRLGYGAMRLPGRDVWGEPRDRATAHAVLRRAVELGINFIDTAWYWGPLVANRLIVEALFPYPTDLVIATKLGAKRRDDRTTVAALTPDELRDGVDTDLQTLQLEQLPLVHLRWVEDAGVPFDEALDVLIELQRIGKVRHLALSNVTAKQLDHAVSKTSIACVQNVYNLAVRSDDVLARCEQHGIAFLPYFPLASAAHGGTSFEAVARRLGCSAAQLSIAYLLARSPVMLPIPGTSKITHLEENVGAAHVTLDEVALAELAAMRVAPVLSASASQTLTPPGSSAARRG